MQKKASNKIFLIIIAILIVLTAIVIIISHNQNTIIQKPNPSEIAQIIENKEITIIDVRTKTEYEQGHIKGAINIPLANITNQITYKKNNPIAVYCRTGKRSLEAAKKLAKIGYTNIYDLGGIENMNIELTTD